MRGLEMKIKNLYPPTKATKLQSIVITAENHHSLLGFLSNFKRSQTPINLNTIFNIHLRDIFVLLYVNVYCIIVGNAKKWKQPRCLSRVEHINM